MFLTFRKVCFKRCLLQTVLRKQKGRRYDLKSQVLTQSMGLCDDSKDNKDKDNKNETISDVKETAPLDRDDVLEVQGLDALLSSVGEKPAAEFPSDIELYNKWKRPQQNKAYRPSIDPKTTSIILFPGQGSQHVGMGKKLLAFPGVQQLYENASEILGYDLLKLCLHGPKSELDKTVHCQPAVFVTSIAALDKLSEEKPWAIERCVGTAGFSLGEYTALVFGGAMSFEDALSVIKVRAEKMQEASERVSSGMLSVYCHRETNLKKAMLMAQEYCKTRLDIEHPVCVVSNYLSTQCKVVAGHMEAIEFLKKYGSDFGIRRSKQLAVSGAFHTRLMIEAQDAVKYALRQIDLQPPLLPVHTNVDCSRYKHEADIIKTLALQVVKPVKWEQTLHTLYARQSGEDFPHTFEVGPANILGSLLKITNSKAFEQYNHIDV